MSILACCFPYFCFTTLSLSKLIAVDLTTDVASRKRRYSLTMECPPYDVGRRNSEEYLHKVEKAANILKQVFHCQACSGSCGKPSCIYTTRLLTHIIVCPIHTRCTIPGCDTTKKLIHHHATCKLSNKSCLMCNLALSDVETIPCLDKAIALGSCETCVGNPPSDSILKADADLSLSLVSDELPGKRVRSSTIASIAEVASSLMSTACYPCENQIAQACKSVLNVLAWPDAGKESPNLSLPSPPLSDSEKKKIRYRIPSKKNPDCSSSSSSSFTAATSNSIMGNSRNSIDLLMSSEDSCNICFDGDKNSCDDMPDIVIRDDSILQNYSVSWLQR